MVHIHRFLRRGHNVNGYNVLDFESQYDNFGDGRTSHENQMCIFEKPNRSTAPMPGFSCLFGFEVFECGLREERWRWMAELYIAASGLRHGCIMLVSFGIG
jgi:hypothetical protein